MVWYRNCMVYGMVNSFFCHNIVGGYVRHVHDRRLYTLVVSTYHYANDLIRLQNDVK